MIRYEYKTHYLKIEGGSTRDDQILEALNAFGREGWRLNRLSPDFSLQSVKSLRGGLNLLLERSIDG